MDADFFNEPHYLPGGKVHHQLLSHTFKNVHLKRNGDTRNYLDLIIDREN